MCCRSLRPKIRGCNSIPLVTKKGLNLKELKPENLEPLYEAIERALSEGAEPFAAFDADGTLWDTDIGENFFKFQAEKKLVDLPENAWEYYLDWHEKEPIPAYLWLAQINKGKALTDVMTWAQDALASMENVPVFHHMRELIKFLKSKHVHVKIVTASVKWAVEPAALLVGLHTDDVIGIKTKVHHGIVTEEQEGPITWREGKVDGILEATGGKRPFFAAGNSTGDLFLLDSASHVALAHCATTPDNPIHQTELDLLAEAESATGFAAAFRFTLLFLHSPRQSTTLQSP